MSYALMTPDHSGYLTPLGQLAPLGSGIAPALFASPGAATRALYANPGMVLHTWEGNHVRV